MVVVDAIRMFDNKWEMYEETRQVEYVPSVAGTIACNEITRSYYIICSRSIRLFLSLLSRQRHTSFASLSNKKKKTACQKTRNGVSSDALAYTV